MRAALAALSLLAALPAAGQTPSLSDEIAATGLTATEARLAALSDPAAGDLFALGGVRFLRGIERAYQLRWEKGLSDPTGMMPILSLPVPANPAAMRPDPAAVSAVFSGLADDMDSTRAALGRIPEGADFGVEVSLADLWLDINSNAVRDPGENLMDIAGPAILGWRWSGRDPAAPAPVIRFDSADAAWLLAYTHLLSGFGQAVLAYDPTDAIGRVAGASRAMAALRTTQPAADDFNGSFAQAVDVIAILIAALNQPPDKARAGLARDHFLSMVAENRRFWSLVAKETDNNREWLPNDAQQSALGLTVPPGTGAAWLAVLADAEALLNGDRLAPYWRLDDTAGVNVSRMFTDPRPIDLAGWIQGEGALPYLEKGTVVSGASWRGFEGMVSGDAMMFSLFLN